jgi:two-component system phosphate regulon response regulator OmpR
MVLKADLPHILAVDDDDRIRRLLAQYLTKNGYIVVTAEDAANAKEILKSFAFDICILDVMMPGENGLDLSDYIRKSYDIPILLLTAMGETEDRIKGLESGADDYLSKPFEPKELLLRLQAILRRSQKNTIPQDQKKKILKLNQREYNISSRTIKDNEGRVINLTEGEATLLYALSQKPNIPIRREMLARELGIDSNDRAVDVQITRLRKKIEPDVSNPSVVQTQRGKGYVLMVIDDD